jgi:thioredoxin 1
MNTGRLGKLVLGVALWLGIYGLVRMASPPAATQGSGKLPHLDDAGFDAALVASQNPVLVDFYADWCGPCRVIAPILEKIAETHTNRLTVYKVNVDHSPKTAARFRIQSIPCLILFKNGEPVERMVGAQNFAGYQAWLAPHLPAAAPTKPDLPLEPSP